VSDSRYVVNGVAALAAGASPAEWKHADLWERLAPHARAGRLRARWTPAHLDQADYAKRGLDEKDRIGNAAADVAAGAAALARGPAEDLVAARTAEVEQLELVQRVLALTELAALRANHNPRGTAPPRVRRRWNLIRRGARSRNGAAVEPAPPNDPAQRRARRSASAPAAVWRPPTPSGLRDLFAGTAWVQHAAAQGPRLAACLRCGAAAARWTHLAASPCSGWAGALPRRVAALLLLGGELRSAGGLAAAFEQVLRRRLGQLPAAPD
jgi:hypothetical protein